VSTVGRPYSLTGGWRVPGGPAWLSRTDSASGGLHRGNDHADLSITRSGSGSKVSARKGGCLADWLPTVTSVWRMACLWGSPPHH